MSQITRNPAIEVVIVLVIILIVATLTFAAGISGALTAAAISGAGLITLVLVLWILKYNV